MEANVRGPGLNVPVTTDVRATTATSTYVIGLSSVAAIIGFLFGFDSGVINGAVGRKPLLLAGSAGMAVTLGVMAIVFATAKTGANGTLVLGHAAAVTGLAAANLYIVGFAMSWGPVMWVLLGEMLPNRMRGAALAVSGATNWVRTSASP